MHPLGLGDPPPREAWQISSSDHSRPNASRAVSALRPEGRQQIRFLQLRNTSNFCYANASIIALMWTVTHLQEAQRATLANSPLIRFIGWLSTQTRPVLLWSTIAWQSITASWPHPGRQHDTSEFLQFLQPGVFDAGEVGKWESRIQIGDHSVQAEDRGTTWPLPLSAALCPDSDTCIQHLVDSWGAQATLHAVSQLPGMLALQIARFNDHGIKCTGKIAPLVLCIALFF